MKIFQKDNQIKSLNRIVIIKDNMQILNPTEKMVLEDGWVEFKAPEPTAEELLVRAKKDKIREIEDYDSSYSINEFYVQGASIWLDKATRAGLKLRFEAEKESGKTDTALWYNGIQYPLTIESAIDMLLKIELYASECYDNTQRHIVAVSALETMDELAAYDYTVGYPEKLNF
jgi:hypothetical protein